MRHKLLLPHFSTRFGLFGHGPKYFLLVFHERIETSEEIRRAGQT
jgi:hypothetical protein